MANIRKAQKVRIVKRPRVEHYKDNKVPETCFKKVGIMANSGGNISQLKRLAGSRLATMLGM